VGRRQDPGGAARETQGETARGEVTGAGAIRVGTAKVGTAKARTAKAGFSDLVLVCRKCARRQGVERKQIGRAVKRALKQAAHGDGSAKRAGKVRLGKVRLVETGCLGPCPKRMLTLATPDSLARRRVILVDPALEDLAAGALVLAPLTAPVEASPEVTAEGAGNG
jgi:hypothetical protein